MKIVKYHFVITFLLIILFIVSPKILFAATNNNVAETYPDGTITYTSHAKTATANYTFRTDGFTVKKTKTNGDPTKQPKGQFFLLSKWSQDYQNPTSGLTQTTFTIPPKVADKQWDAAEVDTVSLYKEGGFYLNGIFRVYHNGSVISDYYYKLKSIMYPKECNWSNPDMFADKFDILVPYSVLADVNIELQELKSNGKTVTLSESKIASKVVGSKISIPKSEVPYKTTPKISNEKRIYLYKLYVYDVGRSGDSDYLLYQTTDKDPLKQTTAWQTSIDNILEKIEKTVTVTMKGVNIVAVYKEVLAPPVEKPDEEKPESGSETKEKEVVLPEPTGIIRADARGGEKFNVLDGIPTTESLYANVTSENYLYGYKFKKNYGKKVYTIAVKQPYSLSWTSMQNGKPVFRTATYTMSHPVSITREYAYWKVEQLEVYGIGNAVLQNYALPNGSCLMAPMPGTYTVPKVTYSKDAGMKDPILPDNNTIVLPTISVGGGDSKPSIPADNRDFKKIAEGYVGEIKVKNDTLVIDRTLVMTNSEKEKKTDDPQEFPAAQQISNNTLYRAGMTIDQNKRNGYQPSSGTLTYNRIAAVGNTLGATVDVNIYVNPVTIHTPTVCEPGVEDVKEFTQLIQPAIGRANLVLGKNFKVTLPTTGNHRYIQGYGYTDYKKYIKTRQVKFPFDTYKGRIYVPNNTWTDVAEDTQFTLPIWVDEGNYSIDFRSISINAEANNAAGNTEDAANASTANYTAIKSIEVLVSGRVYGLSLYDVSDYPLWQPIFRKNSSLNLTGLQFKTGNQNQDGANTGNRYTFPLLDGSHPYISNVGSIKPGYSTRFRITTVGNMTGAGNYVNLKPQFYYVDKLGKNKKAVDVYYSETFNGKQQRLVKVGGSMDKLNPHTIWMGDPYMAVPETELQNTAVEKGTTVQALKTAREKVYYYHNIMVPENLSTYVGTVNSRPSNVTASKVLKSIQNWYFDYNLPSNIYVCDKDYDVQKYVLNHGLDYKEKFWKKGGYLVLNFDIETIQDGRRHLSYINQDNAPNGYCNMWKLEGFDYTRTDYRGTKYDLFNGDTIFYDLSGSAAKDYESGGTH